jgi:hypothetical protein
MSQSLPNLAQLPVISHPCPKCLVPVFIMSFLLLRVLCASIIKIASSISPSLPWWLKNEHRSHCHCTSTCGRVSIHGTLGPEGTERNFPVYAIENGQAEMEKKNKLNFPKCVVMSHDTYCRPIHCTTAWWAFFEGNNKFRFELQMN